MIEKLQMMFFMLTNDAASKRDERGATAVEYGLMVFLIALAIIVTVGLLGTQLDVVFNDVLEGITP
ncbi:Flp family type IVb pilin [Nocardioides bruguierae]|uniref:Flp family type IVb pilin n=1 Tax=Nocardioides bruguierae TaxID=2945102 RepID=A0A9X2IDG0_9ACTN|nr:Flp family type IVb pilin [Nocardioides bruguierae]MCM0619222.1 Flp family type IVb pilin [Nocardioides bruguierae]